MHTQGAGSETGSCATAGGVDLPLHEAWQQVTGSRPVWGSRRSARRKRAATRKLGGSDQAPGAMGRRDHGRSGNENPGSQEAHGRGVGNAAVFWLLFVGVLEAESTPFRCRSRVRVLVWGVLPWSSVRAGWASS